MAIGTRWEDYFAHHDSRLPRPFAVEAFDGIEPGGLAIDLGCGQGTETVELLRRGWSVLAIDAEPAAVALVSRLVEPSGGRLTVRLASFADLTELPPARLVHAGFSLPFCPPEKFDMLWSAITDSLLPGGLFAGQLFGDRDTWAGSEADAMTFHSRAQLDHRFAGWELLRVDEQDEDGNSLAGPKHWHVFHVIARRPA